jgi:hypothetical protein
MVYGNFCNETVTGLDEPDGDYGFDERIAL